MNNDNNERTGGLGEPSVGAAANNNPDTSSSGTAEPKTYTQEEVDMLLQKESDRRVTAALQKAELKNQQKLKEAEKLAAMNEADRYKYELEQREKAIAEKERQLALAENKAEASKILGEKGISQRLVDFVVAEDAETMNANIQLLDKCFQESVKKEVEKRLSSHNPKQALPLDETLTKEKFDKLSLKQMAELQKTNPEIFNKF